MDSLQRYLIFVDASQIISKTNLCNRARQGNRKNNNKTAKKVANDKQARIGCKGKTKFWYGYKKGLSLVYEVLVDY